MLTKLSGKTSALQALSLWELGLRKWAEQRDKQAVITTTTINRYDIYAAPVPSVRQLWRDLNVENNLIEIFAAGFTQGKTWRLGFQFIYANHESINCRLSPESDALTDIFQNGLLEQVGFLPPLSGLAAIEDKLPIGSIQTRIGEGRTADVLRNLCWLVYEQNRWQELAQLIQDLFQVDIDPPEFNELTGRLSVTYREKSQKNSMDLANSGRGFQQILLIFSYVFLKKNTILLVDEPDAHLEILRQKEIYNRLTTLVRSQQSQLIIATHSEAILNEAANADKIIAFLGAPHVVNNKKQMMWQRREIENYLPIPEVVERYVDGGSLSLIRDLMSDYMPPIAKKDKTESWWLDTKMSDDFLDKIFRKYFQTLKQPVSLMSKSNYYELALLAKPDELDEEVIKKLDALFLIMRK